MTPDEAADVIRLWRDRGDNRPTLDDVAELHTAGETLLEHAENVSRAARPFALGGFGPDGAHLAFRLRRVLDDLQVSA